MSQQHDFLGRERVLQLLIKQSVPAMIGLFVMSTYNLVDTIFIGHGVGPLGIAGLAIAFPIQMIIMSAAQTIGIGAASIISRRIGAQKIEQAEQTLGNFFALIAMMSVFITLCGMIWIEPLLKLFGATEQILPYSLEYMRIIFYGTIFLMLAAASNNIIRAEGRAKFAMTVMFISAGTNIVLDPIFIFGLHMGIRGAAVATVIAQITAALFVFYYFASHRSGLRIQLRNFVLQWEIVRETFAIGASVFARHASGSLMAVVLNHSLAAYGGDLAIAAGGIINRILMFVLMPTLGIVQGLQPVLGYNYGAKYYQRAKEAIVTSSKGATFISIGAFLFLLVLSKQIIYIFTTDTALIAMATNALRIIVIMLPVVGFQIVAGGVYLAMGKARQAFILSIMRQVLFLIPLVLILPLFCGLNGLWCAFPVSDGFAALVTFFIISKEMKLLDHI